MNLPYPVKPMFTPFSLNIRGRLMRYDRPAVMAIINVTDDSFFAGSRAMGARSISARAEQLLASGADMLDLGACSARPGAPAVEAEVEAERLAMALKAVREVAPEAVVSVDTWRADVARRCVEQWGADVVNDISGGTLDSDMFATVASLHVPYVMTHTRGTPEQMQQLTDYSAQGGVTAAVLRFMAERVATLADMGVNDIVVDPGFGFAKTTGQCWELMRELPALRALGRPLLVGISRKSMLTRPLGIEAADALAATTAAHIPALLGGAQILRVHDPAEARQAITITSLYCNSESNTYAHG